jgi:hypothetical protein
VAVQVISPLSTFNYPYIQYPLGGTGTYSPNFPYSTFLLNTLYSKSEFIPMV